VTQRNSYQHLH